LENSSPFIPSFFPSAFVVGSRTPPSPAPPSGQHATEGFWRRTAMSGAFFPPFLRSASLKRTVAPFDARINRVFPPLPAGSVRFFLLFRGFHASRRQYAQNRDPSFLTATEVLFFPSSPHSVGPGFPPRGSRRRLLRAWCLLQITGLQGELS